MDGEPTIYTNFDDGTPAPVIEDANGNERRLGLILPKTYPAELPRLTAMPGFRVWSRVEIEDAIRTKPFKARSYFTPDKWLENQKNRGSCCPTATTAASRKAAHYAGANNVPRLAAEFLYAQVNRGSDNGAVLDETMKAVQEIGQIVRDDARHPFNRDILKKNYSPEEYMAAKAWRAGTCYQVDDEIELASLVLSKAGGAVVAVDVDDAFMKLNANGFCGSGSGPGNHAVNVDDCEIINGELAFDMPNSWGVEYGDDGRAYLSWSRHFRNPHRYHKFFVVVGSNFDIVKNEGPAVKG